MYVVCWQDSTGQIVYWTGISDPIRIGTNDISEACTFVSIDHANGWIAADNLAEERDCHVIPRVPLFIGQKVRV